MNHLEKFINHCKAKLALKDIEKKMVHILEESHKKGEGTFKSNVGNFEYYNREELVTDISGVSILKYNDEIISSYTYGTAENVRREVFNVDRILELKEDFDENFNKLFTTVKNTKIKKPKL
jgi:hypothetical protein